MGKQTTTQRTSVIPIHPPLPLFLHTSVSFIDEMGCSGIADSNDGHALRHGQIEVCTFGTLG
jgi:hypothetical protein